MRKQIEVVGVSNIPTKKNRLIQKEGTGNK